VGVGTVAAGVTKAHADHLTISGFDGGTGASPLTSIRHAGSPWEIGLAETHQTLVMNKLRSRVCVQADGGLRTGRDVVIAALLGADEFGFATAPLIAEGCLMMRKCHLNTCPVGVATQDPELRKKFTGKPEHIINYFFFVAEEMRELMAKLGFRTVAEMVGQSNKLSMRSAIDHWKAKGLDYSALLTKPKADSHDDEHHTMGQDHGIDAALDNELIKLAQPALEKGESVNIDIDIQNHNRTFGTMLSGRVAEKYGHTGLPDDTIKINVSGTAGQSFGAWTAKGVTLKLSGEGNDYVGKGLSGGKIIIHPPENCKIENADENIIVGNTVLYGAIAGEAYFNGVGGERFCVRNSGATAVVEGLGDHGCEYMTGGIVVCLGETGRNFAAGMSGGFAYVLDEKSNFASLCNTEMVELNNLKADAGTPDVSDFLQADETRLKGIIEKHVANTGSARGQMILDDWATYLPQFIKVMPVDYRNALENQSAKSKNKAAA
jgi:glutamate synthase (NADPH/NADH) large chain